jgi:hypothetical protein
MKLFPAFAVAAAVLVLASASAPQAYAQSAPSMAALAAGAAATAAPAPRAAGQAASAGQPAAGAAQGARIVAAHPVVLGLARALADGSQIEIASAAPAKLPYSRHPSYFSGRGAAALESLALKSDAVIGLRSIWPQDPLYPLARRANIRVIEIDAAQPIDGALPGLALQSGDDVSSYPWLDPSNMGRMADIIAADLSRLTPGAEAALARNLARMRQELVSMAAQAQSALAGVDNVSVALLSDRLDYLVNGLSLEPALRDTRPEAQWNDESVQAYVDGLKAEDVAAVLHHREPAPAMRAAIEAAGVALVVVDADAADPVAQLRLTLRDVVKSLAS